MDSTLVIKNSHTYCKSLLVIKQSIRRMLLGERLVGVNHRALPTLTQRMTIIKQIMLRLCYIMVHHTCMLRESQTLTQVFLPIHNYSLAWLSYYHLHISKLYVRNQTSHGIKCKFLYWSQKFLFWFSINSTHLVNHPKGFAWHFIEIKETKHD